MIEVKTENNFFKPDILNEFKDYIYKELLSRPSVSLDQGGEINTEVSLVQSGIGRIVMHLNIHKIPEDVYSRTFWHVNKINENMIPNTFMFARYSKKYGIPKLLPHIDNSNTDFTIDCQIDSNIQWPIIIENEKYVLNNNDAIVFESSKYVHWREPILFGDDDYVDMAFFHFIHKDKPNDFKKKASIKGDYIFNYYKKEKGLI